MGSLGVRFEVGRGGGFNYPSALPCLKLVTIMLKVESFFFFKISAFSGRNSTFTQSNSVRAVLEII